MALALGGTCVAVLSVLVGSAAFTMVHARADRVAARAFLLDYQTARPDAWVDVTHMPFGNRIMLRVDVALSGHPPAPPPGVARWPALGESVVSPQFRRAVSRSTALRRYAPARIIGTITEPGLAMPDELVVYRGVRRSDLPRGGQPVVSPADAPRTSLSLDSMGMTDGQLAGLLAMFVVCVGLPLVTFWAVVLRLSARTRADRLAGLHALGLPRRALRTVNGVELVASGAVGSACALVLFPAVNELVAGSGLLGTRWFPVDTGLTVPTALITMAVGLMSAMVMASRTDLGAAASARSGRRRGRRPRRPGWRLAPLGVGLVSLTGLTVGGFRRDHGAAPFIHLDELTILSVLVTGVGLLLAVAPGAFIVGGCVHQRARSLAARVGGARAAFDPAAVGRVVAGVAVLVFAVGVTIGQTRDARAVSVPQPALVDVSVSADDIPSPTALSRLRAEVPFEGVWMVQAPGPSGDPVSTIRASCEEIQRFVRGTPPSVVPPAAPFQCSPGTVYWSRDLMQGLAQPAEGGVRGVVMPTSMRAILDVDALDTRSSTSASSLPSGYGGNGDVIGGGGDATVVFRTPRPKIDAVLGAIYAYAPYSQPTAVGLDPASGANIAMINGFIRLGLLTGLVVGGAALLTGLADRATERRRADHELMAGGASRQFVRRVHRWELALTLGVGAATALVGGILGGLAWQLDGGLVRTPDVPATLLLVAVTAGATVVTVALAERAAPRRLDPAALRED